jgi:hypothetical protein
MPRSVNSQVSIAKIEYEVKRPTWENPLAQMRRGIAIAEPKTLNEIRQRGTWPIRKKTHFDHFDVKAGCSASRFFSPGFAPVLTNAMTIPRCLGTLTWRIGVTCSTHLGEVIARRMPEDQAGAR